MIESADDYSVINLPPQHLKLSYLYLNKNITIKGSPGTVLEILDSSIIIEKDPNIHNDSDNDNGNDNTIKVTFCECAINFNVNKSKVIDDINTRCDSNRRSMKSYIIIDLCN